MEEDQIAVTRNSASKNYRDSHDRQSSYESFESNEKNNESGENLVNNRILDTPFDDTPIIDEKEPPKHHRNDFNDYEIDFDGNNEFESGNDDLNYPMGGMLETFDRRAGEDRTHEKLKQVLDNSVSFTEPAYKDPEIEYQLKVTYDHNEGQLQNVVYYSIKGHIIRFGIKEEVEAKRRFNDFVFLYKLLVDKFYYRVLPLLPEKNKLLKLINNKESIDQRARSLENFITQVINIEGTLEYQPVVYFLFKGQEFQLLYDKSEYKEIANADGIMENAKGLATQLASVIRGSEAPYDRGYYSNFHKEVETLYLFTSNFIENLTKLENNTNTIFKNVSGFVESSRKVIDKEVTRNYESMSELIIKKYHSSRKNTQSFNEAIKLFKMVNGDLRACKEALDRKDRIHKDYARVAKEMQNDEQKNNQMYVAKKYHLEALKQKIDTMEIDLKADLTRHLHVVNARIVQIFRDKMQKVFIDLYTLK